MNALSRLQVSALSQAPKEFTEKIGLAVSKVIVFTAVAISMMVVAPESKAEVFDMTACKVLGGGVGGALGNIAAGSGSNQSGYTILGGVVGAVIGGNLCAPKPQPKDAYGRPVRLDTENLVPLTDFESSKLHALVDNVYTHKDKWIPSIEKREKAVALANFQIPGSQESHLAREAAGAAYQNELRHCENFRTSFGHLSGLVTDMEMRDGRDVSSFKHAVGVLSLIPVGCQNITYNSIAKFTAKNLNDASVKVGNSAPGLNTSRQQVPGM